MSMGGGGAPQQQTPESEIAAKEIELERYGLAKGINAKHLPSYVSEARRDLSGTLAGLANADIMSKSGNSYIGAGSNPFVASEAQDAMANARNTAIIRAYGTGVKDKNDRTDAALRSINGTAESAAKGLLSQANRQSEEAFQTAMNRFNAKQSKTARNVAIIGSLAYAAADKYGQKRTDPAPVVDAKPDWSRGR